MVEMDGARVLVEKSNAQLSIAVNGGGAAVDGAMGPTTGVDTGVDETARAARNLTGFGAAYLSRLSLISATVPARNASTVGALSSVSRKSIAVLPTPAGCGVDVVRYLALVCGGWDGVLGRATQSSSSSESGMSITFG